MTDAGKQVKIFVSWSGHRSQHIARALSEWLPNLMDHLQFWFSSEDLRGGQRWNVELANALGACDVGIVVVTADNMLSPWVTFEAGALSKNVNTARVMPYLLGVEPAALNGPLGQFQAIAADRVGTLKLVMDLAQLRHTEAGIAAVGRRFDKFWPDFQKVLSTAVRNTPTKPSEQLALELLREQVADLGQLVRQLVAGVVGITPVSTETVATGGASSVAALVSDLSSLEGAWRGENGTHIYMRVVNGNLIAPYCFTGNEDLTGVYSDWQRLSDYWFTRFKWIDGSYAGFGFYRMESINRISGQWWMTDGRSQDVVTQPPLEAGVRVVWTRLPIASTPRWAERYFEEQLSR